MKRCALAALITALILTTNLGADDITIKGLDTITVRWTGSNITQGTIKLWGAGVSGMEAYGGIYLFAICPTPPATGEGELLLKDPVTGYLDVFCIELTQGTSKSCQTYDVVMPEDAPQPGAYIGGAMGAVKQEYLRELWGRFFATARASGDNAEVFSACVWEIVYEDNDSVWDVTGIGSPAGRGFKCSNTDTTLANLWLGSLDGRGPKADLRALTNPDHQDFLVQMGPFTDVPEPATAALVALGAGVLAWVRRRRR